MTDDDNTVTRPAATIRITTTSCKQVQTVEITDHTIDDPYPDQHDNEVN